MGCGVLEKMSIYDHIIYQGKEYQTKDTPAQFCDDYEIRGNELWYRDVDRVWIDDDQHCFGGFLKETGHEWKFIEFDGVIEFYDGQSHFKALFMDGKMLKIAEVNNV